jgi:hypothetical protein
VRINDRPRRDGEQNKKIAYLVDLRTIAIYDFVQSAQVAAIDHDARVDWCVLSPSLSLSFSLFLSLSLSLSFSLSLSLSLSVLRSRFALFCGITWLAAFALSCLPWQP